MENQERELPVIEIEGTSFLVDVKSQQLVQRDQCENKISFIEMKDMGSHYILNYSPSEKNIPSVLSGDTQAIIIPPMIKLDPEGMKLAYGLRKGTFNELTDFDIVVDQEAIRERLGGKLPVIQILGHDFFVDLRMGYLRPKDDFSTMGINIGELDYIAGDVNGRYQFPYDPKTHQSVHVDWEAITQLPQDFVLIEIPMAADLDPVSYCRLYGLDFKVIAREHPPRQLMTARIISWKDTPINKIIERNNARSVGNECRLTARHKTASKRARKLK